MGKRLLCSALGVGLLLCACEAWRVDPDGFSETELALMSGMVLTGPGVDLGNPFADPTHPAHDAVAKLGQQLFFDRRLSSSPGGPMVACVDCHSPTAGFSDPRPSANVSVGLETTARNSPTVVNLGFYKSFAWDGRADSIWGQSHIAYSSAKTMAGNPRDLVSGLRGRYDSAYRAAFGLELPPPAAPQPDGSRGISEVVLQENGLPGPSDGGLVRAYEVAYVNVLKAWGAYLVQLTSLDSGFDRYAQGDHDALTAAQKRGLLLFITKAGCIQCHRGANFTDGEFHSVGIGQTGPNVPAVDLGREAGLAVLSTLKFRPDPDAGTPAPKPGDKGAFRTKSLRNVALTGPYFHAGQLGTLRDVVSFYNRGGDRQGAGTTSEFIVPLGLTEAEQSDLVLFLEALTGQGVPAQLACDTSLDAGPGNGPPRVYPCPVAP
jgi:cytochrome c peroxidase